MLDTCRDQLSETLTFLATKLAPGDPAAGKVPLYRAHEAFEKREHLTVLRSLISYCSHTLRSALDGLDDVTEWSQRGQSLLGRLDALTLQTNAIINHGDDTSRPAQQVSNEFVVNMLNTAQQLVQWIANRNSMNEDHDANERESQQRQRRRQCRFRQKLAALDQLAIVFLNNAALVHHSMHKFNISSLYLRKALEHNIDATTANFNDADTGTGCRLSRKQLNHTTRKINNVLRIDYLYNLMSET
jgi:hypothetical protein